METMELVQTREHAKTKCSVPVQQVLHESVGGRLRADSCENDRDLPAHSNGHRRVCQVVAQVTDNRVTQPSQYLRDVSYESGISKAIQQIRDEAALP